MNILSILLMAQDIVANEAAQVISDPAAGAAAEGATAAARQGSSWTMWVMLIGVFAIMYFFMILPQKKAQKEQQKFLDSIQKGTKVVTAGGIYGVVTEVRDAVLLIEVDKNVVIKVAKSSVQKDPAVAQLAKEEK